MTRTDAGAGAPEEAAAAALRAVVLAAGANLRQLREAQQLDLRSLADQARALLGDSKAISYASLSRCERGQQPITLEIVAAYALILKVPPALFLMVPTEPRMPKGREG